MSGELSLYTVYGPGTRDMPGVFVCRRSTVSAGVITVDREPWATGATLESVRDAVPVGLARIPRMPGDDWNIVEVWL